MAFFVFLLETYESREHLRKKKEPSAALFAAFEKYVASEAPSSLLGRIKRKQIQALCELELSGESPLVSTVISVAAG